jgi:hypothetical protein
MRKQLKVKRRSCKMCKPHKMGWERRWTSREAADLRRFERERATEMKYRDAWSTKRTGKDHAG